MKYLIVTCTVVPDDPENADRLKELLTTDFINKLFTEEGISAKVERVKASVFPRQLKNPDGTPYGG